MHFSNHPHLFTAYPRPHETRVQEGGSRIPCPSDKQALWSVTETALSDGEDSGKIPQSSWKTGPKKGAGNSGFYFVFRSAPAQRTSASNQAEGGLAVGK